LWRGNYGRSLSPRDGPLAVGAVSYLLAGSAMAAAVALLLFLRLGGGSVVVVLGHL